MTLFTPYDTFHTHFDTVHTLFTYYDTVHTHFDIVHKHFDTVHTLFTRYNFDNGQLLGLENIITLNCKLYGPAYTTVKPGLKI